MLTWPICPRRRNGPSTFPFTVFPGRWRDETLQTFQTHRISRGDTVVGNDVWFGRDGTGP